MNPVMIYTRDSNRGDRGVYSPALVRTGGSRGLNNLKVHAVFVVIDVVESILRGVGNAYTIRQESKHP